MTTAIYAVRNVTQSHVTIVDPSESDLRWTGRPGLSVGDRVYCDAPITTRDGALKCDAHAEPNELPTPYAGRRSV